VEHFTTYGLDGNQNELLIQS